MRYKAASRVDGPTRKQEGRPETSEAVGREVRSTHLCKCLETSISTELVMTLFITEFVRQPHTSLSPAKSPQYSLLLCWALGWIINHLRMEKQQSVRDVCECAHALCRNTEGARVTKKKPWGWRETRYGIDYFCFKSVLRNSGSREVS